MRGWKRDGRAVQMERGSGGVAACVGGVWGTVRQAGRPSWVGWGTGARGVALSAEGAYRRPSLDDEGLEYAPAQQVGRVG